jgi:hypothetical protein
VISKELRADLIEAIKKTAEQYDQPEYTTIPADPKRPPYTIMVQPFRMLFSRTEGEKGLCRTLSISWIPAKSFTDDDLPEWKALVEEAVGHPIGACGFAFIDQKRIYCYW